MFREKEGRQENAKKDCRKIKDKLSQLEDDIEKTSNSLNQCVSPVYLAL